MSDALDPQEAATLFYAGHPLSFVDSPDEPFVCGQWMGKLAFITKLPFSDQAGAVAYFTDNPVTHAAPDSEPPVAPPVAGSPPEVVDAPHISQADDTLSCTMGNWIGEPTGYAYQWRLDGAAVWAGSTYQVTSAEAGRTADCILTASNAFGSTTSTSNSIIVVDPTPVR